MYPILYKIGPIHLYTYGFFLALGFLTAILVAGREARRLGLPEGHFYDLCFYIILAAIIGSRLLFVIVDPAPFLQNPLRIFAVWEGGWSSTAASLPPWPRRFSSCAATRCLGGPPWTPWRWACPWAWPSGASAASWQAAVSANPPTSPGR
jgi:hypothetical protein